MLKGRSKDAQTCRDTEDRMKEKTENEAKKEIKETKERCQEIKTKEKNKKEKRITKRTTDRDKVVPNEKKGLDWFVVRSCT